MSITELRAFRFLHPDFDTGTLRHGLVSSPRGGLAMVEQHAALRQSVLLLLSTTPGERVMRPDYGCDLHRLLFSPNDATTAGLAVHYVRQAIERFEPRVQIESLTAQRSEPAVDRAGAEDTSDRLYIELVYVEKATRRTDRIAIDLDLTGS